MSKHKVASLDWGYITVTIDLGEVYWSSIDGITERCSMLGGLVTCEVRKQFVDANVSCTGIAYYNYDAMVSYAETDYESFDDIDAAKTWCIKQVTERFNSADLLVAETYQG